MASQKKPKRSFNGLGYREIQRVNSISRDKLTQEEQNWLKAHHFKNVSWEGTIQLYLLTHDILEQRRLEKLSLKELFLEVEKLEETYQTNQSSESFRQELIIKIIELNRWAQANVAIKRILETYTMCWFG